MISSISNHLFLSKRWSFLLKETGLELIVLNLTLEMNSVLCYNPLQQYSHKQHHAGQRSTRSCNSPPCWTGLLWIRGRRVAQHTGPLQGRRHALELPPLEDVLDLLDRQIDKHIDMVNTEYLYCKIQVSTKYICIEIILLVQDNIEDKDILCRQSVTKNLDNDDIFLF